MASLAFLIVFLFKVPEALLTEIFDPVPQEHRQAGMTSLSLLLSTFNLPAAHQPTWTGSADKRRALQEPRAARVLDSLVCACHFLLVVNNITFLFSSIYFSKENKMCFLLKTSSNINLLQYKKKWDFYFQSV